jgi:hypothetical protein
MLGEALMARESVSVKRARRARRVEDREKRCIMVVTIWIRLIRKGINNNGRWR